MSYTLSYFKPTTYTKIKHPKWWQVWERATLVHDKGWEQIAIHNVQPHIAKFLIEHGGGVIAAIVPDAQRVCLEQGEQPTQYISTNSAIKYGEEPYK